MFLFISFEHEACKYTFFGTFPMQLYEERGIELCIVAADINLMDVVYFHVKTVPDMPIYLAARASASIPGNNDQMLMVLISPK